MSENGLKALWDGIRRLTAQLREGRYWTDRRDASQELFKIARQAAWRVQQAARDRDPDVAHWGAQACAELKRLITAPNEDIVNRLDHELATAGLDPDQAAPAGTPSETLRGDAGTDILDGGRETALATPEALLAWLESFAAQQGGTFTPRPSGASIALNVEEGRRQTLYLDLGRKDSEGELIALFYSICGEARPEHFLWALQVNSSLSGGAFGVIQRAERSLLIMLMRWRLAELSGDWLRQRLFYLARKADWAESKLKEKDEY